MDGYGSCACQPSLPWLLTLRAAEMTALGLEACTCACTAHEMNLPCHLPLFKLYDYTVSLDYTHA